MTSSKCVFSRAMARSSGFFAFGAFSPAAGLPPLSLFGALSAFCACSGLAALSGCGGTDFCFSSLSAIDLNSRTLGHPHLLAAAQHLEADPRRLAVLRIGERQVRQVDRPLLRNDAALLRGGLL